MSILSAIRQQSSSIDDLAKLPQAMIMQMAQRKQIAAEMVAPILARKAEIIDAAVKTRAMQQGAPQASVMEQILAKNAQSEQPMIRENTGIAQIPVPEPQYAGGGIIAFDEGGDVDEEDDDTSYEDYLDELERYKLESLIHRTYDNDGAAPSVGIGYVEAAPTRTKETKDIKEDTRKSTTDADQSRKYNVGNLRPSGFSYPGQIGISKGGFAMFDSPEAGINALYQDIGIKLNRGLDTPTKFISVYAPAEDKNDVKTYSNNVAKMLGIGPNDKIPNTPEARQLLANAIIRQEGAHKATAAFAGGGAIAFQGGGTMGGFDDTNYDMDVLRIQKLDAARKRKEYEDRYEFLQRNAPGVAADMPPPAPSETRPVVGYEAKGKRSGATEENIGKFLRDRAETNAAPAAAPAPAAETPVMSAEDKMFAQMQDALAKREARLEQSRQMDPYLALLSAGFGMISSKSPYGLVGIGEGGGQGVAQFAALQRARAAEEAGIGALQNKVLSTALTGATRKDLQAQANSAKYANALTNVRQERLQLESRYMQRPEYMDLGMIQVYAQRLAKDPNDKDAKIKYEGLMAKKQALENKIRNELPDPDPSLFGVKGVGGTNFAGFSATERKR